MNETSTAEVNKEAIQKIDAAANVYVDVVIAQTLDQFSNIQGDGRHQALLATSISRVLIAHMERLLIISMADENKTGNVWHNAIAGVASAVVDGLCLTLMPSALRAHAIDTFNRAFTASIAVETLKAQTQGATKQ